MAGPLQMPPELIFPVEDDLLMPQVPSSGRKRLQRRRSRRGGQRRAEMILTLPHRCGCCSHCGPQHCLLGRYQSKGVWTWTQSWLSSTRASVLAVQAWNAVGRIASPCSEACEVGGPPYSYRAAVRGK
ncbi:Hypothetical predicted protein [Podarcis lilfordi]|uniref:Uncharacterized protein n=1 Tax=Podarcis lilfordi TaxID=74358 RepID=A0AA35KKF9_9SAUR|nr:Hypothetical predicted protein [Podarcis lilfordi]